MDSESESLYAQYPNWKELKREWRQRLTSKEYTPLNEEKLPYKLVPKILLKLYEVFPDYDAHRGKVLRKTLAACRLVCRRWSVIVTSVRRRFIIQVDNKEWPSSTWYIVRPMPLRVHEEEETTQESCSQWFPETYSTTLAKCRLKFLLEFLPGIIQGLYICRNKQGTGWESENRSVIQGTLAACCLVSREWNRIYTPILYADIFLGRKKPLRTRSLLHRTFQHIKQAHKALVKTVIIRHAEDGSTSNLLSICFSLPNLRRLILDFERYELSALHPSFVQQLQLLSKGCTVQMMEDSGGNVDVSWGLLPRYIKFVQRAKSTSRKFWTESAGGRW